jgi:hypothetical protein
MRFRLKVKSMVNLMREKNNGNYVEPRIAVLKLSNHLRSEFLIIVLLFTSRTESAHPAAEIRVNCYSGATLVDRF